MFLHKSSCPFLSAGRDVSNVPLVLLVALACLVTLLLGVQHFTLFPIDVIEIHHPGTTPLLLLHNSANGIQ